MLANHRKCLTGALDKEPSFAALNMTAQQDALLHATARIVQPGELVFDEDSEAAGLYFLTVGAVQLSRRFMGRTLVIGIERAPSTLVTLGLFGGGVNSISGLATCRSEVHLLDRGEFRRLCTENLMPAWDLLSLCCRRMGKTFSLMDGLASNSVRQRVARLIIEIAEHSGTSTVDLSLSSKELAARLGTAREVVFRNLKSIEAEGIIRFHRRVVVINDMMRLKTVAGDSAAERIFDSNTEPAGLPFLADA